MHLDRLGRDVLRMRLPQRLLPLINKQQPKRDILEPGLHQLEGDACLNISVIHVARDELPHRARAPHGDDVAALEGRKHAVMHARRGEQHKAGVYWFDIHNMRRGVVQAQATAVGARIPGVIQIQQGCDDASINRRGRVDMDGKAGAVALGALDLERVLGEGEARGVDAERGVDGGVVGEGGERGQGGERGRGQMGQLGFEDVALGERGGGGGGDDVRGVGLQVRGVRESIDLAAQGGRVRRRDGRVENGVSVRFEMRGERRGEGG